MVQPNFESEEHGQHDTVATEQPESRVRQQAAAATDRQVHTSLLFVLENRLTFDQTQNNLSRSAVTS